MEHRWGQRVPMDTRVRLTSRPHAIGAGRLRDASISGAFIETNLELPPLSLVSIEAELAPWDGVPLLEITACVVRSDSAGIAVEWLEFAPADVVTLIARTLAHDTPLAAASRPARPSAAIARPQSEMLRQVAGVAHK